MEDNRIHKFGEVSAKVRSPSPARGAAYAGGGNGVGRPAASSMERKISAPANMTYSGGVGPYGAAMNGVGGNGSSSDMQCFMNLLEREETDFVEQVKKSKAFIQSVIRNEYQFLHLANLINIIVFAPIF